LALKKKQALTKEASYLAIGLIKTHNASGIKKKKKDFDGVS
jgi:hypothetical protein